MLRIAACILAAAFFALAALSGAPARAEGAGWRFGFAKRQIVPDEGEKLYIAGYHNGKEISGVLDLCEARAVWLDAGGEGVVLVGIDCVALDSACVNRIRDGLKGLEGCSAVHVYATHTHAGPDTLGLWGPVGRDGKNASYMKKLEKAAQEAAREAAASAKPGALYFGSARTDGMCLDSRYPRVYDETLYQLRFEPLGEGRALRLLFFGAHAESLRGDNRKLSRDFPGSLCDTVSEMTGGDAMFFPGAIGGLIMTRLFAEMPREAALNMRMTGDSLASSALSIARADERELKPALRSARVGFTVPLDNGVFLLYRTLGILGSAAVPCKSATGMGVATELNVILLGDVALALIPGEIFPELVMGGGYGGPDGPDPAPLRQTAAKMGFEDLLIVGLANDELGYIVPPSDFLVHGTLPYLERITDSRGEDHYEETNSVGPECARCVAEAFASALAAAAEQPPR